MCNLRNGLDIDLSITTDAKLIPVLLKRDIESKNKSATLEKFRSVVSTFEGSTAIGVVTSDEVGSILLALRGGGQGLYVGLGQDEFLIASEPYGVVEISSDYIRVDGELPHDENQPVNSRGQILKLNNLESGEISGIERIAYDGKVLPIENAEICYK
jgi:glucosamine--fructose-6-phosphate aminotransferase (isomerizing)